MKKVVLILVVALFCGQGLPSFAQSHDLTRPEAVLGNDRVQQTSLEKAIGYYIIRAARFFGAKVPAPSTAKKQTQTKPAAKKQTTPQKSTKAQPKQQTKK